MRIRELKLIRYGKFTDRTLLLPRGERDIHFIVGPNEAGKSTVRTAIGDWLFGIPMRTPLGFLHPMPELRIGGVIERKSAGSQAMELLAFDRTKGNKNTLRSPEDGILPEGMLQPWLGNLQAQSFNRMYALDHTTLVEGGDGILSASDDIGRMLFQSASGVEHLGDALQKLQTQAEALWAPRKSGSRSYYRALDAFDAAHANFKQATLRTKDWKAQHDAMSTTQAKLVDARARDVDLRQQVSRLERIRRVRPLLLDLDAAHAQRAKLLVSGDIPLLEEGAAVVLARATQEIALADAAIARFNREILENQASLQATTVNEDILAMRGDITELNERRLQFRAHRTDMVKREEEIRLEWVRVQELAKSLGWSVQGEDSVRQSLPATQLRARLTSLINERSALALDLKNALTSLSEREDQIQQAEAALLEVSAGAIDPDLVSAVDQALTLGDHEKLMADLQEQTDELSQDIEDALAELGKWSRPLESLREMLVPDTVHIQSLIDQQRADAAQEKTYYDAMDEKSKEIVQLELELQQFVRDFQPVSIEQVLDARCSRDLSWHEIKQSPESLLERAEGFEVQIKTADVLADDRLNRAQYEADRQSKTDTLEHKRREHADLEHRLETVKMRMVERIAQWDELALTCGLPSLPLEMALSWLQSRQSVLDLVRDRASAVRRRSLQEAAAAQIKERLWAGLGRTTTAVSVPELSVCLREARALITQADQAQGQRKTLEQQIREGQRSISKLQMTCQLAQQEWDRWMQSWKEAAESIGYFADTPVSKLAAELDLMQEVERLLDRIRSIRSERIETMQADLDGLAATALSLSLRIAPDIAVQAPEDVALELNRRLDLAQKAEQVADSLLARLEISQNGLTDAEKDLQVVHAALAPLMASAGVDNVTNLARVIERSDERRSIEAKILTAQQNLIQAADGLSLDQLRSESVAIGADELKAQLDRLTADSRDVVEQIASLSNEFGAQKIAFDALDGTDLAARAEAQRQEAIADMADSAEQYLRLQTAARLLKWSIEKFRETKQGPMLSKASTIFNKLTTASFSRLLVDAEGDTPRLIGVRSSGEQVDVIGMSEGTRDQLYLALRLAALEVQVEQGLNIPLIADDLFINFDDRRTAAGLKVIGDLSRNMQVIFLTHHDHLLPLAKDVLGTDLNVVYL